MSGSVQRKRSACERRESNTGTLPSRRLMQRIMASEADVGFEVSEDAPFKIGGSQIGAGPVSLPVSTQYVQ
jgi:hypothetical protein